MNKNELLNLLDDTDNLAIEQFIGSNESKVVVNSSFQSVEYDYSRIDKIEETLVLKETSLGAEQLKTCGPALMDRLGVDELFARIPPDSEREAVRHGMLCILDREWERLWPDGSLGYMNLILD